MKIMNSNLSYIENYMFQVSICMKIIYDNVICVWAKTHMII